MKKTFVSNASASMQQYAQLGKKHEYWFAVPQERSVSLLPPATALHSVFQCKFMRFIVIKITGFKTVQLILKYLR